MVRNISGVRLDLHFEASAFAVGKLGSVSKLEMVHRLLGEGFVAKKVLTSAEEKLARGSALALEVNYLMRSTLLFQVLIRREEFYQRGLSFIVLNGPHHYNKSILTLKDLSQLAAIGDVAVEADSVFKRMLKDSGKEDTIEDIAPAVSRDILPGFEATPKAKAAVGGKGKVAVAPLAVTVAHVFPPTLQPMSFEIPYGDITIKVSLDGCSHQSRFRRVYSTCHPSFGHIDCHKYTQMRYFDEPWKSVAWIYIHMTEGVLLGCKSSHMAEPPPTVAELESARDLMPAIMFPGQPFEL